MIPPVRTVRPDERSAVEALLRRCRLPVAGLDEHFSGFLVAEGQAGAIVGCIGLEDYGGVGLLRSLAVEPAARGRGVGRALVERLVEQARRRGVHRLYLLTTTAAGYFERWGFAPVDRACFDPKLERSEELRGACPESAVGMLLELGGAVADGPRED